MFHHEWKKHQQACESAAKMTPASLRFPTPPFDTWRSRRSIVTLMRFMIAGLTALTSVLLPQALAFSELFVLALVLSAPTSFV